MPLRACALFSAPLRRSRKRHAQPGRVRYPQCVPPDALVADVAGAQGAVASFQSGRPSPGEGSCPTCPTCSIPTVLALPLFDDAHRALAHDIGRWCAERAGAWASLDAADPGATGRAMLAELGRAGWLRHLDPDRPDSDLRSLCLRRQALAYHEDLADFAYAIQELTAAAIVRHGSQEQQRRYLPGLATGTSAGALALSEPGAGSDLAAVALEAVPDGDGFVLNGTKTWIAQGDIADVCVVLARTGDGPGPLGLTTFLVDTGVPGFKAEPIGAIAPRSWAQLDFTDVRVGADAVLGERGQGFVVALDILEQARATVAAAAIGFARRAFDSRWSTPAPARRTAAGSRTCSSSDPRWPRWTSSSPPPRC